MHLPLAGAGLDAMGLRRLLSAAERLAGFDGAVHDFPAHAMRVLCFLLDADTIIYAERDAATGTVATCLSEPLAEYPLIAGRAARLGGGDIAFEGRRDGGVQRLSDMHPLVRLRDMAIYGEALRPLRVQHNLNFGVAVGGAVMLQFGVCRESAPDFEEAEMRLADAIRPWLARSYSAAVMRSWTGLRPDALLEATPLALTPRQREILRWAMAGKSNELIGQIVGRSAETVKNHLRAVYRRLGVHSRIEAALKVARTAPSYIRAKDTEVVAWQVRLDPPPPRGPRQGAISPPPARRSRSPRHSRPSPP